jgi:uncharacterized repeat protein (TIGR01451 family)
MKTAFLKSRIGSIGLGLLLVAAQSVWAQSPVSLKSTVETERMVKQADGQMLPKRSPVKSAVPGEEVIFTNTFSNVSTKPAADLVLTNPIATDLRLKKAWGEGATITYSVDGGKTYDVPEHLKVPGKDGKPRAAKVDDYTHVRWGMQGALAEGASTSVGFNAVVR